MGLLLSAIGCSRSADSTVAESVPLGPIAECVQYEHLLASCFHRDAAFASQPGLIPKSRAAADHIRDLCRENLARLGPACR
jgi:hypothetical protein